RRPGDHRQQGRREVDARRGRPAVRRAGRLGLRAWRKATVAKPYRPDGAMPWLLTTPAVLLVVTVTFLPVFQAASLSLHETTYLKTGKFIGLAHYARFFDDPLAWQNIRNSVVFTFGSL